MAIIRQVVTLLNDLRRTALIAGIAMAAAALWGVFSQFLVIVSLRGNFSLLSINLAVFSFLLLDVPLPVFLLILYRSGITPSVSKQLRNRALVSGFIKGLDIVYSGLHAWRQPRDPGGVGLSTGSHLSALTSEAIGMLSMVAFALFLLALSRQERGGRDFEPRPMRLVKRAALIAAGSRALYLVLEFLATLWVYSMQRRGVVHNVTSAPMMLRAALFALPGLAAPLIVYVSIGTSHDAVASEDGHNQVSATA